MKFPGLPTYAVAPIVVAQGENPAIDVMRIGRLDGGDPIILLAPTAIAVPRQGRELSGKEVSDLVNFTVRAWARQYELNVVREFAVSTNDLDVNAYPEDTLRVYCTVYDENDQPVIDLRIDIEMC